MDLAASKIWLFVAAPYLFVTAIAERAQGAAHIGTSITRRRSN